MLNTLGHTRTMTADFDEIPELNGGGSYNVVDAWTGDRLGCKRGSVDMQVATHGTAVLLLESSCSS